MGARTGGVQPHTAVSMQTDPERDLRGVVQSPGYSGWLGTAVQWWKTGARLPLPFSWECFSVSPGTLTVRGAQDATQILLTVPVWNRGSSVPPGPQQLSRNWSCSAWPTKLFLSPRGRLGSLPGALRAWEGAFPLCSQSGWHRLWGNLNLFSYLLKWILSQGNSIFILQATVFFLFFLEKQLFSPTQWEGCLWHGSTSCRLGLLWEFNGLKEEAALAHC